MASSRSQTDELRIVIGRDAILAANREICASAQKEICMFDKPPYGEDHAGNLEAISAESSGGRPWNAAPNCGPSITPASMPNGSRN